MKIYCYYNERAGSFSSLLPPVGSFFSDRRSKKNENEIFSGKELGDFFGAFVPTHKDRIWFSLFFDISEKFLNPRKRVETAYELCLYHTNCMFKDNVFAWAELKNFDSGTFLTVRRSFGKSTGLIFGTSG